ncbi:MAG: TatD family hydrolase [Flavobacteriales bacterium]|nr:TatD family hydrolase [Flavobacteriales bacterium]
MQLEECILFSAGFHPWYINEDMDEEEMFRQLMNSAKKPNCIMIGESGIDKIKGPSITKQAWIFLQHIQVAEQLEKPLIIHAVKSLEEILAYKQQFPQVSAWIIPGFNSKKEIVLQWIRHGSYLSFGKEICLSSHPAVQALKSIPTIHLLLETDESIIPIITIYQCAANLLSVSEEALEEIISSNVRKIIPVYEQYMDAANSHFDR